MPSPYHFHVEVLETYTHLAGRTSFATWREHGSWSQRKKAREVAAQLEWLAQQGRGTEPFQRILDVRVIRKPAPPITLTPSVQTREQQLATWEEEGRRRWLEACKAK